jgi:Tol biopolymer transport system component
MTSEEMERAIGFFVIAWTSIITESGDSYINVFEVHVDGGSERTISSYNWGFIGQLAWLSDGSGLIINGSNQTSGSSQIWRLSYPDGETRRITNDVIDYTGVSLTRDSTAFVTVMHAHPKQNIWVSPVQDPKQAKQIPLEAGTISWTPDGKIAYDSYANGNWDIWITDKGQSNARQLTLDDPHTQ